MRETSKAIKEALKEEGIDTRQISVTHKWCGYSEAYYIKIKSFDIDIEKVREITKIFKEIDIDERTGEVLLGGNTYIWVDYDYKIMYPEAE